MVATLACVGIVAIATAVDLVERHAYVASDTAVMVQHVQAVIADVHRGQWSGWSGQFPLLQQLPAFALLAAGLSATSTLTALVALNAFAFAALLALAFWSLRRTPRVAALFTAVLLISPLVWYAHASFGEMLAALAILALVVSCATRAPRPLIALSLVAGCISKDTAAPFLVALAVGASVAAHPDPGMGWRRLRDVPWITLGIGAVVGLGIVAAYNFLEFGTVTDQAYLQPIYQVGNLRTQAVFAAGIVASPNGGLLTSWPAVAVFIALVAIAAWRGRKRHPAAWALPIGLVALSLAGLIYGFADWVAPLGWIAWGPRLLLPWIPAAAFVLTLAVRDDLACLLDSCLAATLRFWSAGIVVVALSIPQFVVQFRESVLSDLFLPDTECPRIAYIQQGAAYYYRCTVHEMWTKRSVLVDALTPDLGRRAFVEGVVSAVALGVTCLALMAWLRHRAVAPGVGVGESSAPRSRS